MSKLSAHGNENYELHRALQSPIENLDQHVALAALKQFETRRNPSGLLHSAWSNAEYALNLKDSNRGERDEFFHTSRLLTAMALAHPKVRQETALNALTLATYLPVFNKRASEAEVSGEDCDDVYRSLGQAMGYLRPLAVDEPPQWRMVEIASLALSARSHQPQLLLYPASPREEATATSPLNHDSYFLDTNGKIPIQQKLIPTQKVYDECIKVLTMQPLLDKAHRKSGKTNKGELGEQVNHLLSLIVSESSGVMMERGELIFLNEMTEAVVSHYFMEDSDDIISKVA